MIISFTFKFIGKYLFSFQFQSIDLFVQLKILFLEAVILFGYSIHVLELFTKLCVLFFELIELVFCLNGLLVLLDLFIRRFGYLFL